MIPIGIEINKMLQIELEQQKEIERKTVDSLFSTICIDPEENEPVEETKKYQKKGFRNAETN
jgi:hypothetical protein